MRKHSLTILKQIKIHKKKSNPRIIQCYLQTGDKYFKIKLYKKALQWYGKAVKLDNQSALVKIGKTYEAKADNYTKHHKYEQGTLFL